MGFSCRLILQCCQKICDPTVSPTRGHGGTHPARGSIWFTWAYRDICRILTNVQLYSYWRCTYVCSIMYIKRDYYMKTFFFSKNTKLVTLLLNVCFDLWCHASNQIQPLLLFFLSNVKNIQIDLNVPRRKCSQDWLVVKV